MRSIVCLSTLVAFVGAPAVHAADGPTDVLPGYCDWSPEPALDAVFGFIRDADCTSAVEVPLDPRFTTSVVSVPVFEGPREFGKPAGESLTVSVVHNPTPLTAPLAPAKPFFLTQIYRDYKAAKRWWSGKVNGFGQAAGDSTIRAISIGPSWMKDLYAAGMATSADVAGGLLAGAPEGVLAVYVGGILLVPGILESGEQLNDAPAGISHGASDFREGIRNRRFDQSAEGVAEVCGGVGLLLSAAVPFTKFGAGLTNGRAPITPFVGRSIRGPGTQLTAPTSTAHSLPSVVGNAAPTPPLALPAKLKLTQSRLEHIVERHWETAGSNRPPAGHFNEKFSSARELKAAADRAGEQALWSRADNRSWSDPTPPRRYRVQYDPGEATGVDRNGSSASRIEFIVEADGTIVTAYPIP